MEKTLDSHSGDPSTGWQEETDHLSRGASKAIVIQPQQVTKLWSEEAGKQMGQVEAQALPE
jgi:hypothetical protein